MQHPTWCIRGALCTAEGIHHSRPLPAVTDGAEDLIRLWLEKAWDLAQVSIVMEVTVQGEVTYTYMQAGQARILRHQLGRLLNLSKGGAR
ncbi:hypothetical protein [Micromonospora fulviviridis]|uniref:hypothetical protein n=1 Tax=Micromonospora fulviviridis TaxID=47860 RepID=UPI00166F279C|nr:hypothetical protein [Micromonospora fulviviridis]